MAFGWVAAILLDDPDPLRVGGAVVFCFFALFLVFRVVLLSYGIVLDVREDREALS